jgi:hypothetical protein
MTAVIVNMLIQLIIEGGTYACAWLLKKHRRKK